MGNKKAWAVVLVTVGLGALLSLPAQGARPSLAAWEWGFTATFTGAGVCVGIGWVLFWQVGRASRDRLAAIRKVTDFQAECRQLRERVEVAAARGLSGELAKIRTDKDAWVDKTYAWFADNLDEQRETFRNPRASLVEMNGWADDANDLLNQLLGYADNLTTILRSVSRDPK